MLKFFTLTTLALLVAPLFGQGQDGSNNRELSPEEIKRRRDEAFKDATAAGKKIKTWTAKIKVSVSNPVLDSTVTREGKVTVKNFDEKTRWLLWEEGYDTPSTDTGKMEHKISSYALYKGLEYLQTDERAKVVEKYDFSTLNFYFPQLLARDGLSSSLEANFTLEFISNAKYMKTDADATEDDWKQLGFKSKAEFDEWIKNKKATGTGNTPTNKSEIRPFKDKEDKFDKANKSNVMPNSEEAKSLKYYALNLIPTNEALKQDIKVIRVQLAAETFLPLMIMIDKKNDSHVSVVFSEHQVDPKPEIEDAKFQINTDGFQVKQPQKEGN